MKETTVKHILAAYFAAMSAGIIAFLLAMNLRTMIVGAYIFFAAAIPWSASFINAVSVIILMLGWLIYVYVIQHHFEKKCSFTLMSFVYASRNLIVPVVALYLVTEAAMWF